MSNSEDINSIPTAVNRQKLDFILLGLLTLTGLMGLALELVPILRSGIWPDPPSPLFGPHLNATIVYITLFSVAVWIGRKIGHPATLLCTLPFLVLALTPFLAKPPPDSVEQLRIEAGELKGRLSLIEGDLADTKRQLASIGLTAFMHDFAKGTQVGEWHDLGVRGETHVCFLTGVKGSFAGGAEQVFVAIENGTWQLFAESNQPSLGVRAACLSLAGATSAEGTPK